MRIRLSKKGWNNVLIFASMFMILLFNYSHKMITGGKPEQVPQSLVPAESFIQSLDFSGIKLERIGTGLRVLTDLKTAQMNPASNYVDTWQGQPFELLLSEPLILDSATSVPVVVWVAGQASGWVYRVVIDEQQGTVYIQDSRQSLWYAVGREYLTQLVPAPLLQPED